MVDSGKKKLILFIDSVLESKVWINQDSPILSHPYLNTSSKDRDLLFKMQKDQNYQLLMKTMYAYEDAFDDDWLPYEIVNLKIEAAKLFLIEVRDIILTIDDSRIEEELIIRHERIRNALNDKEITS